MAEPGDINPLIRINPLQPGFPAKLPEKNEKKETETPEKKQTKKEDESDGKPHIDEYA